MKTFTAQPLFRYPAIFVIVAMVLLWGMDDAKAQFPQYPLHVGSLDMVYTATGGQQEYWTEGIGLRWPAISFDGVLRADAQWIAVRNHVNAEGEEFPYKVAAVGPRVTGFGAVFPVSFWKVARFEPTHVTVDGEHSLHRDPQVDEIDPNLPSDQMIETVVNTITGVTLTKRIYAWSLEGHDNYHIAEYILENTGHVSAESEGELADQTAEGTYLNLQKRYVLQERSEIPGSGWGANVLNKVVGDGMEDYDVDFSAVYTFLGNSPGADIDPMGGPAWDDSPWFLEEGDDGGILTAQQFAGLVTLDATESPDAPRQPSMTGHIDADDPITSGNDPLNVDQMRREYLFLSVENDPEGDFRLNPSGEPHMYPHHADQVVEGANYWEPVGNPDVGRAGGWQVAKSFGPYDLAPGETARIVVAEAVSGISQEAAVRIGQGFKQLAGGDRSQASPGSGLGWEDIEENYIYYDAHGEGEIGMPKNQWWFTGQDSLFQTFERALANYESGYNIPRPPNPPTAFTVQSGVDEIAIRWEGDSPAEGFELYRSRDRLEGRYADGYHYELIAGVDELGPAAREHIDTDVTRGVEYYYYLQAVGEVNQDPTGLTPTGQRLKSGRYYTQTYDPASLARPPGPTVDDFVIVPNPYNISSSRDIRWDTQDRLGFLDVPGNAEVRIYTETGELVEILRHDDGSGDVFWDMTSSDRQVVVSGVYIAVVEDLDTGAQAMKKFVIIR